VSGGPTSTHRSAFGVWLDLARAGNFPSVWSNVLCALVLSASVVGAWPPAGLLVSALVAGCLAYAGGTTLNDVFDFAFDQKRRPERAIPRGLITRANAALLGSAQLLLGLAILVFLGASPFAALGLATTIVLYDWVHKRWAGSVLLMAGCRVMLAVTLSTLPGHTQRLPFFVWVGGLFFYIVILSVLARREYKPGAPAEKLGQIVRRLLAFIPFVDAIALLLVGAWIPAACCAVAVPLGRWAQRRAASS